MNPSLITLIINLVLVGFVLFGFLGGLRGIKKSTFSLVMFVFQLIVIFIIAPIVSRSILTININGVNINNHIINGINDMVGPDASSSALAQDIITSIPVMLINILTTIVLIIVGSIIFKIIGAILYRLIFGKDNTKVIERCEIVNGSPQMVKSTEKKKKHRLWGGVVGAIHGLLFALVLFFPICGMVNIFNDITMANVVSAEDQTENTINLKPIDEMLKENVPSEVFDYVNAINNSVIYKIGKIGNISEVSFNIVAKSEINGKSVMLGEEIRSVVNTYNTFINFATSSETLTSYDINSIFEDIKNNPQNYDFDKLYLVIDNLFSSNIVNAIGEDALKLIADVMVDNTQDENILKILNHIKTAIYNYADYTDAKLIDDFKAFVGVFEICLKTEIIKTLEQEEFEIEDDIKSILLNEADIATNKQENDVLKQLLSKITSSKLLQKFILEFTNYGIEELEILMNENLTFSDNNPVSLTKIDSTQDFSLKSFELEKLLINGLELYENVEGLNMDSINEDFFVVFDANVEQIVKSAGNVLNGIVSLSILNESGVFNSLCDAFCKTEYNKYVDFNALKTESAIKNQFNHLATSIGELKNSGIISVVRNYSEDNLEDTINQVITILAQAPDSPTNQETYVSKIVGPLLKCTIFKNALEFGLGEARVYIETSLKEKNPDAVINKFNTSNLMSESENASILDALNNLVQFASNINFNNLLSDKLIDELMLNENNFVNLGLAMDSIKNTTLFSDYIEDNENVEGVYKNLMNALSGIPELKEYFDFSSAKQDSFKWIDTTSMLQTLCNNLNEIMIGDKTLIKYMLSNTNYDDLLKELKGKEIQLTELFKIEILKPTSIKVVNLINSTIKNFVNDGETNIEQQVGKNIVDINMSNNIVAQANDINNVINRALQIDFDAINNTGIENITDENLDKIKDLLNAMEQNANSTEYDGVFKQSYNALLVYMANSVNEEIKSFVGESLAVGIYKLNGDINVAEHKQDIITIVETALNVNLESFNIESINETEQTNLNNLLNAIQINAIKQNSPFAIAYNSLMIKIVNLINNNVKTMVGELTAGSEIKDITTPISVATNVASIRNILNKLIDFAQNGTFNEINIKTINVSKLFSLIDLFAENSSIANNAFAPTYNSLLVFIVNTVNKEVSNAVGTEYNAGIITNYSGTITPNYNFAKELVESAVEAFSSISDNQKIEDINSTLLERFIKALETMIYTQSSKTAIENYLQGLIQN